MKIVSYADLLDGKINILQKTISPPSYNEFKKEEEVKDIMRLDVLSPPLYSWFIPSENAEEKVELPAAEPVEPSSSKRTLKTKQVTNPAESSNKTNSVLGAVLSSTAAVFATLGVAAAVVGGSHVVWFMFVGGLLALILSIVGERLNRRNPNRWYIRSIMYSVFSLISPVLLYLVGWLSV